MPANVAEEIVAVQMKILRLSYRIIIFLRLRMLWII